MIKVQYDLDFPHFVNFFGFLTILFGEYLSIQELITIALESIFIQVFLFL